jgi:hypothetical protein
MVSEIKNSVVVELSPDELDNIAGGFCGILSGVYQNLELDIFRIFLPTDLVIEPIETLPGLDQTLTLGN